MAEKISAEELDRLVDEGKEDVLQYFDFQNARRGNHPKAGIFIMVVTSGEKVSHISVTVGEKGKLQFSTEQESFKVTKNQLYDLVKWLEEFEAQR